jgi:hypothetical protein
MKEKGSAWWIPLFIVWWVAMFVFIEFFPIALSSMYEVGKYTFDLRLTTSLFIIASYLVFPIFPIYILWFYCMGTNKSIFSLG